MKHLKPVTVSCIALASILLMPTATKSAEPAKADGQKHEPDIPPQRIEAVETELLGKTAKNIEACRKGDAVLMFKTPAGELIQNAEVEVTQTSHEFLFGATIFGPFMGEEDPNKLRRYQECFKTLFNFAVFPFYWRDYEPKQGMTEWGRRNPLMQWCKSNAITIKGHPLVWTNKKSLPTWLEQYPLEVREELLKARVVNVMGGFQDSVNMWDVLNEPVHTRVWNHPDAKSDYINEPIPPIVEYVDKAFRWAHTGNANATLILNEYSIIKDEWSPPGTNKMRQRFYSLVKELKDRGCPLSGLGIQGHEPRAEWFLPEDVWAAFDTMGQFGYPLHITEFTGQDLGKPITGGWRKGVWTPELQAEFADQFYRLCFGHPAIVSINWWGLNGLLTDKVDPKPAYRVLDQLINHEWKTHLTMTTDSSGRARFRGFYGKYAVQLKSRDGKTFPFSVDVSKKAQNQWELTADCR